jgi:hypothetical protein
MPYIDSTETSPNKSLYFKANNKAYSPELAVKYHEKLSKYKRNNKRVLGAIKSIISIENTERFKDKTSAKDLFDAIKSTFGKSSLKLIGRYLDRILEANYNSFSSIDEYTSQIQSLSIYLKELNYELPKPFLAWLLFKGLPSSFDSFISRKYEELAKDIKNIDISKLISDLISEEARMKSNVDLEANKATKINKTPICKHWKKKGHLESKCFIKYPELRPNNNNNNNNNKGTNSKKSKQKDSNKKGNGSTNNKTEATKAIMSAFSDDQCCTSELDVDTEIDPNTAYFTYSNRDKLVLDSGATEHYTPNKDWLLDYKDVSNKSILIANGDRVPIKGIGNIPVLIGDKEVLITNVSYIPSIKTTLISPKELT